MRLDPLSTKRFINPEGFHPGIKCLRPIITPAHHYNKNFFSKLYNSDLVQNLLTISAEILIILNILRSHVNH